MTHRHRPVLTGRCQRGAALLLLLLAALLGFGTLLAGIDATAARLRHQARTEAALAQAREALLARAVHDANRPGSLPCPDLDGDGVVDVLGGQFCRSYVGRFPYKTLDLPNPTDGYGETLWYALAPALRDRGKEPLNSHLAGGMLSLDGRPGVAAVVFSAGPPLPGQTRPGNAARDYLDGGNAVVGSTDFVSSAGDAGVNDRALALDRDALFHAVARRVLAEIAGYRDGRAPHTTLYGLRGYLADNGTLPAADEDGNGWADAGAQRGRVPWRNLTRPATPSPLPQPPAMPATAAELKNSIFHPVAAQWLVANEWLSYVGYEMRTSQTAGLTLDGVTLSVTPCPSIAPTACP